MAYDEKFRRRVVAYKEAGHTFAEVREAFGTTAHSYYQWKTIFEKTGRFGCNYPKEHAGKIDMAKLLELVKEHPAPYMATGI